MSFITISDNFSEPSSRVVKGGNYQDDDHFDIMNFQIEQWRKKVVGKYDFQQVCVDQPPSNFPPAWAILLHLRANAVRALLLRPFFFSNTTAAASRRNIQPGLNLITETIDMVYVLDGTTDIYRMHHPCFQHILATSCALLSLIVAYVEQNHSSLSAFLPDKFAESISRNFRKALSLANAYRKSSRASRRLWKRLVGMEQPLVESGLLQHMNTTGPDKSQQTIFSTNQQPSKMDKAYSTTKGLSMNDQLLMPTLIDLEQGYPFSADSDSQLDSLPGFGDLNMDWGIPLTDEMGTNNTSSLFWSI